MRWQDLHRAIDTRPPSLINSNMSPSIALQKSLTAIDVGGDAHRFCFGTGSGSDACSADARSQRTMCLVSAVSVFGTREVIGASLGRRSIAGIRPLVIIEGDAGADGSCMASF